MKLCPNCGGVYIRWSFPTVKLIATYLDPGEDVRRKAMAFYDARAKVRLTDMEIVPTKNLSDLSIEDSEYGTCQTCGLQMSYDKAIEANKCSCGRIIIGKGVEFCQKLRCFVCSQCKDRRLCSGCRFTNCLFREPGEIDVEPWYTIEEEEDNDRS